MLPEQSDFTSQSISQLQVPSSQVPWELQSLSIKQTNAREIKIIKGPYSDNLQNIHSIECNYCGAFQKLVRTRYQVFPLNFDAELTVTISK